MSFLLNNPPKLSGVTSPPSVPVEYVSTQEVMISDQDRMTSGFFSVSKSDVPQGATMVSINLKRNTSGSAYFIAYLSEQAVLNYDDFIYNVMDKSSGRYAFSFAIPDGVTELFFDYGGRTYTDVFSIAYT